MKEYLFIHDVDKNFKKDKNKLYVAIIGSRAFNNYEYFKNTIDNLINTNNYLNKYFKNKNVVIVSGGAKGADTLAYTYAKEKDIDIVIIKPDWQKYKRGAGFKRNTSIVNLCDMCIAFIKDNSKGSLDTLNKVKKQNKKYFVFEI